AKYDTPQSSLGGAAERPPSSLDHRHVSHRGDLHSQVVAPIELLGPSEDRPAGGLGRMGLEELLDVVVRECAVDAIAALGEHVTGAELEGEHVDRDDELAPEAARERVPPGLV